MEAKEAEPQEEDASPDTDRVYETYKAFTAAETTWVKHTTYRGQEQGDPSSSCCAAATMSSTQEQCYICGVYTSSSIRLDAYGLVKGPPCPYVACSLEHQGWLNNWWLEQQRHKQSEVQSCAAASPTATSGSACVAVETTVYQDQEWGPAALIPHHDEEEECSAIRPMRPQEDDCRPAKQNDPEPLPLGRARHWLCWP